MFQYSIPIFTTQKKLKEKFQMDEIFEFLQAFARTYVRVLINSK
jgi:hypothetical protein